MPHVTKTGALIAFACLALYLAAQTSQSGMLLFLIGICVGCLLAGLPAGRRVLRDVEIKVPATVHLSEGQHLMEPWRIINRGRRPAGLLELQSPAGTLLRLAHLPSGQRTSVVPDLAFPRRGVYPLGEVEVLTTWPFGLLTARRPLALAGEVVVCPAVYPAAAPRAAGFDRMVGGKQKGRQQASTGAHFAGVRPLCPGDPLKQIHWKSSAKGLGLMVKTFEEELSGRVALILDAGHRGNAARLDDCLRAAGSLMFAALDAGHHVEWIDLGTLVAHGVPPFGDGQEILDSLARLKAAPDCLTEERLRQAVAKVSPRGALSFVLTGCDAVSSRAIEQLARPGRPVALYLPVEEETPDLPGGVAVHRYRERGIER